MKSPWSTAPAVPAALILCTGIAVSYMCTAVTATVVWTIIALSGLLTLLAAFYRRHAMTVMAAIATGAGVWSGYSARPISPPDDIVNTRGTATCLVRSVKTTDLSMRAVVDVVSWTPEKDSTRHIATGFRALCIRNGHDWRIRPGVVMKVETKLLPVTHIRDIPYQTDYNRFLHIDGVTARMFVYTDDVTVVADKGNWPDRFRGRVRDGWLGAIVDAGFDKPTTAFMLAVLGGDTLLLDGEVEEDFRRAGLSHILAISGMHVGIVTAVLLMLLYPVKLPRQTRRAYFIGVAGAVWLFAVGAGLSPSVCRAALMCTVFMLAKCFETKVNPFNSLAVALSVIAIVEPRAIFMPGLQFSVCAVLSIITFVPRLDFVPRKYPVLRFAWLTVIVPPVAVMGTAPLTIFYFHSFPAGFWITNIMAAVFIPVLVSAGFLASLLSIAGISGGPLVWICDTTYDWITRLTVSIPATFGGAPVAVFLDDAQILALIIAVIMAAWLVRHFTYLRFAVVLVVAAALTIYALGDVCRADFPRTEVFIPRHTASTDVVVVHDNRIYLWTTMTNPRHRAPADRIRANYADYFLYRGLPDSITTITGDFNGRGIVCHDNILEVDGLRIGRVDNDSSLRKAGHVNVAIVTEIYNGAIDSLATTLGADSILLSHSIHYRRADKWRRLLRGVPVAWRSLDDRGFVWSSR